MIKILLPLTKSTIGAMAVYTFINAWNMYLWPLLVTGSDSMRTVQIGIGMLDSVDSQSITLMIAGVVMIIFSVHFNIYHRAEATHQRNVSGSSKGIESRAATKDSF